MSEVFDRKLRWIGWVITLPATALIVLALQEHTKDWVVEVPGRGVVLTGPVPAESWRALEASKTKEEFKATLAQLSLPVDVKVDLLEKIEGIRPTNGNLFTAHTKVNKLKLLILLLSSAVGVTVLIQGSVSILTRRWCGNAGNSLHP